MTTPITILLGSSPVQITAALVTGSDGPQLSLQYRGVPLSEHDDQLEIFLDSASPVTVEIPDIGDPTERWTVTAKGTASDATISWTRGTDRCLTSWNETESEVKVLVTATNAAGATKTKPFFIKVRPQGARPWP